MGDETLEPLENILGVSTVLARAGLRRNPELKQLGVDLNGRLVFRRSDVERLLGRRRTRKRFADRANRAASIQDRVRSSDVKPTEISQPSSMSSEHKRLHPLVVATRKTMRAPDARFPREMLYQSTVDSPLLVEVSKGQLERALRSLDALIRRIESAGFELRAERGRRVLAIVDGESISLRLRESMRQRPHELTPDEKDRARRLGSAILAPKFDYSPSGELRLEITTESERRHRHGSSRTWREKGRRSLDTCVDEIVEGLRATAAKEKHQRVERARREAEWREQERRAAEERRRAEEERRHRQVLIQEVQAWEQSQSLRRFIAAVTNEARLRCGEIEPGSALASWVEWASRVANELDPVVDSDGTGWKIQRGPT